LRQSTSFGKFSKEISSHDILSGRFSPFENSKVLFFKLRQLETV